MKLKLQSTFQFFLICLLSSSILFATSCKKDETLDRVKFLGTYQVNENCSSNTYSYSLTVTESATSDNAIIIQNFGNFVSTINVTATVNGDNISFTVTQDGVTISGRGTISGDTLTIIYQATGAWNDSCTSTCIKQ